MTKQLIAAALQARKRAYCPYSRYAVGAALLGKSGKIYTGCNIENASYPATVCAERTALFKAVSEGEREFSAIAIVGGSVEETGISSYATPCGICRQALYEFAPDMIVICAVSETDYREHPLGKLLPEGFGAHNL